MDVRHPIVAGQFYPASAEQCRSDLATMLSQRELPEKLPKQILATVVPHAGWMFSGDLAMLALAAVKRQQAVTTFILLGAIHSVMSRQAMVYAQGQWQSPLGPIDIDQVWAERLLAQNSPLLAVRPEGHRREHSLEVLVPMIQYLFPQAKIVPIMVPPTDDAHEVGELIADVTEPDDGSVVAVASTDLTHYGPNYAYTPLGTGPEAIAWAKDTNDTYFIDLALALQADTLVESAVMYHNACGAGATAAAVAYARLRDSERGILLDHTTSAEIMQERFGRSDTNSVGYAALLFGKN